MHNQAAISAQGVWMAEEFLCGNNVNCTTVPVIDFTHMKQLPGIMLPPRIIGLCAVIFCNSCGEFHF